MKITFVLPGRARAPVGGYAVIYTYADLLARRGHEVAVCHPRSWRPSGLSARHRLRFAVGTLRDSWRPGIGWFTVGGRVRLLFPPDPDPARWPDGDAVFATAWQTADWVSVAPRAKGEKFYLVQHHETWGGPPGMVNATWRLPLHKIVIAKWLLAVGEELGAGDMQYLPNAIDHRIYRQLRPLRGRPRRVAMLFSRQPIKGAAFGIEALIRARVQVADLQAVLFGTAPRPAGLPDWIEYHRKPRLSVLVGDIYNGSSIYLAPSVTEGWPLPPAEAACCGCALVASDNGGIREYVEHGRTGLLSPPRDPEALSRDLCRVLGDEALRFGLAEAARQELLRLDWARNAARLEAMIASRCSALPSEPARAGEPESRNCADSGATRNAPSGGRTASF